MQTTVRAEHHEQDARRSRLHCDQPSARSGSRRAGWYGPAHPPGTRNVGWDDDRLGRPAAAVVPRARPRAAVAGRRLRRVGRAGLGVHAAADPRRQGHPPARGVAGAVADAGGAGGRQQYGAADLLRSAYCWRQWRRSTVWPCRSCPNAVADASATTRSTMNRTMTRVPTTPSCSSSRRPKRPSRGLCLRRLTKTM